MVGFIIFLGIASFKAVYKKTDQGTSTIQIIRQRDNSVINTENPREIVGFSDYYFVAKIENTVIKNIKGQLPLNKKIHITKAGGVLKDKSDILVLENEILPEDGKTYIIAANTQKMVIY